MAAIDSESGTASVATSGNLTVTYNPSAVFYLENVTLHLGNTVSTTGCFLTVTLDSTDGSAYDTTLLKHDLGPGQEQDVVYLPDLALLCQSGDQIVAKWDNTDSTTTTAAIRIVSRLA